MATTAFIRKRIAGKEKEIEKLTKKLERIRKAEATNWEKNPYDYTESDLRWALQDLEDAQKGLEKYQADLAIALEKENSRNVPAILMFLDLWKDHNIEFYREGLTEYYREMEMVRQLYKKYESRPYQSLQRKDAYDRYLAAESAFYRKCRGYFEDYEETRGGRTYRGKRKVKDGEYEHLKPYCNEKNIEAALAKLKVDLDIEADRKYDFIIERTNAIVGTITDASGLHVGDKGDLNGYIIGEKGRAKVQTIGAGGYNIQCFHFRTLINAA